MKGTRVVVVGALLAATAAYAAKPVLRVNGTDVLDTEVDRAKAMMGAMPGAPKPDDQQALHATLDQIITRLLLIQAARDAKTTVDPSKVKATLDAQRTQAGGADAFTKRLAANGLTEPEYARMMEENLLLQAYVKTQIVDKTNVGDGDVKAYFDQHPGEFQHPEQVKLRMIMTRVMPGADAAAKAAAKAKIDGVHEKLVAGADFAATAKETSDHPNKENGGEAGWIRQGMIPDLEKYFWDLKPGAISQVAEAPFGFVIFKVDERRPAGPFSFEEVQAGLTQKLKTRSVDEQVQRRIAELRAKAKLEPLDPAIKAALEAPMPAPLAVGATGQGPGVHPVTTVPAAPTKPAGNAPKSP